MRSAAGRWRGSPASDEQRRYPAPGSNFIALDEHSGGGGAMSSVAV
jgi:hypothetical protein